MCVPLTALRLYTKDSEKGRYKGVLAVLPIRDCFISPYLFIFIGFIGIRAPERYSHKFIGVNVA